MDEKSAVQTDVEIDVGALLSSLIRKLPYVVVFVAIVAIGTYVALARLAPVYKAEATVIIDNTEADLTRTTQPGQAETAPDTQAIASQMQLVRSTDVEAAVAKQLNLASLPEFDPTLAPPSAFDGILGKLGLVKPLAGSADDRVLKAYVSKLDVYAVDQSRVIGIDFSSTDPRLAADAANAIADGYIAAQRSAQSDSTKSAADFLSSQIDDLRGKVVAAESKEQAFRAQNNLFTTGGQASATLPDQQLADLNSQLSKVRSDRADAEAKAGQIRAALAAGSPINVPDVLNSPLIQALTQQEVALKSQIAQLSATLLPQHPRMKELNAQLADLDKQIGTETNKILSSLDANAKLEAANEDAINAQLANVTKAATTAGSAGVQLAELDREASAQRDLLDQYLRSYREAVAREDTANLPVDARIVSRASPPLEPDFPKKVPMTTAASVAAAILAIAVVLLTELASGRPMRRVSLAEPLPMLQRRQALPHDDDVRPAIEGDGRVRRIRPSEPTLAPALGGRVEESLNAIAADIAAHQARRVIVTLADGSGQNGRPLAALALARTLAAGDDRVVLVDFSADAANAAAVGEGAGEKGLADVFDGGASFSDVLFRDARSRVHFVPAGSRVLGPTELVDERLETILSALTLTYDQVVLDAREDAIARLAPGATAAMVTSEFAAGDHRTERAFARIRTASEAEIHLLVLDPASAESDGVERAAKATAVA